MTDTHDPRSGASLDRLAATAAAGDTEAFRRLAVAVAPLVHRLAWRILADSQAAADCVQEFLIRLLRILPGYDRSRPFWPWAQRVATRQAIDLARREQAWRAAPLETLPDPPDRAADRPDERVESAETAARIQAAALALPARQRAVFVLRDLEDWTTAEIAGHLDMAESTVRVHLARARVRLREALEGDER